MPESEDLLQMEPLQLVSVLNKMVQFVELSPLDDEEAYKTATELLNCATAYVCYFKQMETIARVKKREAKQEHKETSEINRLLGIEEVFETFKKIAECKLELVAKTFTAKRLVLEEFRQQSKMV